jgi:hypothetical protein
VTTPGTDSPAVVFHRRYLELADEIERVFPVARWRAADLEVWPLARMDLYLDLYRMHVGIAPLPARALVLRALERFALPLVNLWKSRHDLRHWVARPKPADAIFLGDGVSLDRIDGHWRDRYGEPLMAALQRRGRETFVMQTGDLSRLPWYRSTYAANIVALRGAKRRASVKAALELPQHAPLMQYLANNGVNAPSLSERSLLLRAKSVLATAAEFESVLRVVRPTLAFVVTYYADLGPAFLLACRRQGVLSVDLQHCPHEGAHKAYTWRALPDTGYAVLPAVFWNWTQADAMHIEHWISQLSQPWHRSVFGGHIQLASFLRDTDPATREMDAKFDVISRGVAFEREILVTLQPVSGYRAQWEALAAQIEAGPREWRWWIRRHPASRPYQDEEYRRLVSLRLPNVVVEASLSLPLPALLRHMSVLVSRFSGASAEAANFGVPALFLSEEARGQFSRLIERGAASVVEIGHLIEAIAHLPRVPVRPSIVAAPQFDETLSRIEQFAHDYAQLCRSAGHQDKLTSRRNVSESRSSSA